MTDPARPDADDADAGAGARAGADETERRKRSGQSAAAARIAQQGLWVDQQIRVAMARGDFDDLPGRGKPIEGLGAEHDPDWWVKKLVERERISVLPPALQLRKDDAELDARLDRIEVEREVRRELEQFNERVLKARYTPVDGPPLVTQPRDVEAEVAAWRRRLEARRTARRAAAAEAAQTRESLPKRRRWWRPGSYRPD